jgi:DNA-binding protein HU-beta
MARQNREIGDASTVQSVTERSGLFGYIGREDTPVGRHRTLQRTPSNRSMTKSDIVDRIAQGTGLTKLETEAVVDGFLKTVIEALSRDEHVEIRGYGTFRVKERAPRIGRNPRTGETVSLDNQFVPHFKVSRELRQLIDESVKSLRKEKNETSEE